MVAVMVQYVRYSGTETVVVLPFALARGVTRSIVKAEQATIQEVRRNEVCMTISTIAVNEVRE